MIDFSAFSMNKELDLVKHNFIPFNPTINLCYIRTDWIRPEAPISLSVLSGVFVKCINSLTYPRLKMRVFCPNRGFIRQSDSSKPEKEYLRRSCQYLEEVLSSDRQNLCCRYRDCEGSQKYEIFATARENPLC